MNPQSVLTKTPLGVEALDHRDHELTRTLRHALILVDGQSTLAELEAKGAIIPDFVGQLRELLVRGLIAPLGQNGAATPVPAPGPASANSSAGASGKPLLTSLVSLAHGILGGKAGKVVKKLEEAGASREELGAAVEACFKLIRLTIDEAQAEEFRRAAKEILARGG
jgi:hypothetical protein